MIARLLDIFGFLSVFLRAAALILNSSVIGGAVFLAWALHGIDNPEFIDPARRLVTASAAALAIVQVFILAVDSAVLSATAGIGLSDVAGASFFLAGLCGIAGAVAIVGIGLRAKDGYRAGFLICAVIPLASLVAVSHAMGRVEHRAALLGVTAVHQAAAGAWIGGLPYLVVALIRARGSPFLTTICRRFSCIAIANVLFLAASGAFMSVLYIGSIPAAYGTSYGVMVGCKVVLLFMLLILGAVNRKSISKLRLFLLRYVVEAEIFIGVTAILAAASVTSQPPAIDLQTSRVTAAETAARFLPRLPRLSTPPLSELSPPSVLPVGAAAYVPGDSYTPNTPGDIAWSEYNHNWAGLIVLAAGILAILASAGVARWARNWPLAFLGLAVFLFLRADPENWPLGPKSFWQSFAVAEVLQHRIFVLLIVAFAAFEWGVRMGRIRNPRAALVFPLVCVIGGALLLTHSHPIGNIKESFLAELSHMPLAIFAVMAGSARWLELRAGKAAGRLPAWIWPPCLLLIGMVLLNYRES